MVEIRRRGKGGGKEREKQINVFSLGKDVRMWWK
jgi:hypothetical protein